MERQGCGPYDALSALESLGVDVYRPANQRIAKVPYFDFSDGEPDEATPPDAES